MWILLLIGALLLLYIIWQVAELRRFSVTEYEISSSMVKAPITLAVLSDLHSFSYGPGNERLLSAVRSVNPDLILMPGDMIVTARTNRYAVTESLMKELVPIAPVFASCGNHESRAMQDIPEFAGFLRTIERTGVVLLDNAFSTETVKGTALRIYGLSIPLENYKRGRLLPLPKGYLEEHLGPLPEEELSILLAHDPAYAKDYFAYGPALTLSGHNHGGLVCLPNGRSVFSPRLSLFPEYGAGRFEEGKKTLIVSRGLGTHTYHVRIFNRAELVVARLVPETGKERPVEQI